MSDVPVTDLVAADEFRETLLARADAFAGQAPLWHGWVISDAYVAGLNAGRAERQREVERLHRALSRVRPFAAMKVKYEIDEEREMMNEIDAALIAHRRSTP